MATPAILEYQIAAKRPFAVVTGHAALSAADRKMLGCPWRADLLSLWQAGGQRVTSGAVKTLTGPVFSVTEGRAKSRSVRRGAREGFFIVAHAARSKVTPGSGLTRWRMTSVALAVRIETRGNRKGNAAVKSPVVASRATVIRSRRSAHVLDVIELDVEILLKFSGKSL